MDPVEPSPRKVNDPPNSAESKVKVVPASHGVESLSNIPQWPSGRLRSHLRQGGLISSQDGTLPPSGWYKSGVTGRGGPGISGLLGSHPDPNNCLLPALLPPKKRALKSLQLQGHPPNAPHNYSMQSGRISTTPPRSPAATTGSKSQVVTVQSVHRPSEYSAVGADKSPRNNPRELVKIPKIIQPNNGSAPGTMSTRHNTALTFHATKTTSAQPQLKDYDADVTVGWNNENYSSQPMRMPNLKQIKGSGLPSLSAPNTGLKSHVTSTISAEPHLKDSNADVSQCDDNEDLWSALRHLTSARKRLHSKKPLPIVEEVTNVTRKKARLGWGQGLAKYEKEKREKGLLHTAAIGISGELRNSSTEATDMVACPGSLPAFSYGSTCPLYSAISAISDQGSHDASTGATNSFVGKTSSMTEKVVCPASGCNPPQVGVCHDLVVGQDAQVVGVDGDPGNSSTSRTRVFAHQEALPSCQKQIALQGHKHCILSTSTRTTELMAICSNDMPSFTSANSLPQGEDIDLDGRSMRANEAVVSPGTAPSSKGCSLLSEGSKFSTVTTVQDAPHKLATEGGDKTEIISASTQGIELAAEIIAAPDQETGSHTTTSNKSFRLITPKLEEPISRTSNENRSANDNTKKYACFIDMAQDIPHKLISQGSDKIEGSVESGGDGLVQQQNDTGAMEIDTKDDDQNIRRDERNPQHFISPNKISGTIMNLITEPTDVENSDTMLIPEGNEIAEPQQLISNESPRISQLSSHSDPAALQAVNAKSSDVKFEMDLNIAYEDVASVDVYPSHVRASIDVIAHHQPTQIDLNIPDPAAMNNASDDGGPANFNLGANVEMVHDLNDVQKYLLPQTNAHETTNNPADQRRCFMLFGKVIFQAQADQNHGCSCSITSNTSTYGQSYPSGPWDTWRGVSTDSCQHQSFSNQLPYGSVNVSETFPFRSPRSTYAYWRKMPNSVNMTPQSTTRADLAYHMGSGGESSNLHNLDHHLADTSRPQAPGPITQPETNREGASTSNTWKGKENIG